ncbi:MAG: hypothetical protein AAGE01_01005 [Pseudomonadota bacterium]
MNTTAPFPDSKIYRFAVISIVLMLALNIASSFVVKGWIGAGFNTALVSLIWFAYAFRARNAMLWNWLILALVAGFAELAADWWLVTQTKTLVYVEGPKVVVSPIYMPFAWMLVLVQIGIVSQWLRHKMALPLAALVTGLIAGLNIPLYESLAKFADWWYYRDTPMILNAPYYIILGEFLIGLPLAYMGLKLMDRIRPALAAGLGLVLGAVIWVSYYVAVALVG